MYIDAILHYDYYLEPNSFSTPYTCSVNGLETHRILASKLTATWNNNNITKITLNGNNLQQLQYTIHVHCITECVNVCVCRGQNI